MDRRNFIQWLAAIPVVGWAAKPKTRTPFAHVVRCPPDMERLIGRRDNRATGGTFTLSFIGKNGAKFSTKPLRANATAEEVQVAIDLI